MITAAKTFFTSGCKKKSYKKPAEVTVEVNTFFCGSKEIQWNREGGRTAPELMPKREWFHVDVITCATPYLAKRKDIIQTDTKYFIAVRIA